MQRDGSADGKKRDKKEKKDKKDKKKSKKKKSKKKDRGRENIRKDSGTNTEIQNKDSNIEHKKAQRDSQISPQNHKLTEKTQKDDEPSKKTPEKEPPKSPEITKIESKPVNNNNNPNSAYKKVKTTTSMTFPKTNYKRDCTKNMSYYDIKEEKTKIKMRIIIPEYIVSHLHQRENFLRDLETKNKCKFAFIDDRENQVSTCEGIKGQLVQFGGSLKRVMKAINELISEIKVIEQELNGKRKS